MRINASYPLTSYSLTLLTLSPLTLLHVFWGIDLGGTKIEGVVMTSRHPDSVIARHRIDTEGSGGYEHVMHRIKSLVDHLIEVTGHHPDAIGIGTPGTIDPQTSFLKNSNTLCLNHHPLDKDLEKLLGVKVAMANDANCFALAEYHLGVVARDFPDAKVVFGVIMGTGVGGTASAIRFGSDIRKYGASSMAKRTASASLTARVYFASPHRRRRIARTSANFIAA